MRDQIIVLYKRIFSRSFNKSIHIVWLFIIAYTVFFSWFTIQKHYAFWSTAGDLGFYDQAFWSTLNGRPLYISLWNDLGNVTLAYHVEPILFLFLPAYAICPGAETLLVLQSFFLALGALPIYWIAKRKISESAGMVFAALYLMYPALHGINQFDFHFSAIAIPLFLFSFYYAEERSYPISALFGILTIMCKEDATLTIGAMALYVFLTNWKEIKKSRFRSKALVFSVLMILISVIWFLVATQIIVPHFNATGTYLHLGKFFPSLMKFQFPVSELLFGIDEKFIFALILLAPLLFLSLLDPLSFMITLPSWAILTFSQHAPAYHIGFHYSYSLVPFIFVAAIYGLERLMLDRKVLKRILALLLILGVLFVAFESPTPLGVLVGEVYGFPHAKEIPTITEHDRILYRIIDLVPQNASLSTQNDIFPHVCHRFDIHCWYYRGDEYVLMDNKTEWFEYTPDQIQEIQRNYDLISLEDGISLYKIKSP
jgi:uncharacterized membrane protein